MALVTMKKLLTQAQKDKKGVGAFSVGNMEMNCGAIQAAEELNVPIILQIAQVRLKHSPLLLMGPMMVEVARKANVDVAVHLDHGLDIETLKQALDYGFTSVMLDSSSYSIEENIERTKKAVELASKYGATVEAELGVVGGSEDGKSDNGIICTNPQEAKKFCEETGVDALAVAIGNAHGNYPVAPKLAFDVLSEIYSKVQGLPLVLHGGSGISDEDFQEAIRRGITKVNIATASFNSLTKQVQSYLLRADKPDYFGLNEAMKEGTYKNIKHHIRVFEMEDVRLL